MPLAMGYLEKLEHVLAARREMVVVARTDAASADEMYRRARAFAAAGADAVLIDGLKDLVLVRELSEELAVPVCFNQIAGGRSPAMTLDEHRAGGVRLRFSRRRASSPHRLLSSRSSIVFRTRTESCSTPADGALGLADCTSVLDGNLDARLAGAALQSARV